MISRATTNIDVENCRRMFYLGFLFLPFLWLVNYWYYKYTLSLPNTPDIMKKHLKWSLYAFGITMCIWLLWLLIFYLDEQLVGLKV